MMKKRKDKRLDNQIRPVKITRNFLNTAEGSALIELGNTKIICAVSIEDKLPPFLASRPEPQHGWLTAEYSLLPRSTAIRTSRERNHISGRTAEIQRLIGRALRTIVDLTKIGPRTITIDCDVIQADGGTRTASITGSFVALYDALNKYKEKGLIQELPIKDMVAAISVGIVNKKILLDLTYKEDSKAAVDMNFVITKKEKIIEVQGTAELIPFSKEDMDQMYELALVGVKELFDIQRHVLNIK